MKIVRIFEDIKEVDSLLWAIKYPGNDKDEFNRLFDLWVSVDYLYEFFEKNIADLANGFWGEMEINEAIEKALDEAEDFMDMLYEIAHGRQWGGKNNLLQLFQPLDNRDFTIKLYQKQKSKPQVRMPFLRLYAIKLEDNTLVITGGAIKLTEKMDDREHLQKELAKLEKTKQYLRKNDVIF